MARMGTRASCPTPGSGFAGPGANLVPGIHVLVVYEKLDVDGRNKSGHDEWGNLR